MKHGPKTVSWQCYSLSKVLVLFGEEKKTHDTQVQTNHCIFPMTAETYSLLPVFTPRVLLWMTDSCRAGSLCVTIGAENPQQQQYKVITWTQEECEGEMHAVSTDRAHPLIMGLTFVLRTWMKQQLKALVSCPPQIFTQDSNVSLQTRYEKKTWMFNQQLTALPVKILTWSFVVSPWNSLIE